MTPTKPTTPTKSLLPTEKTLARKSLSDLTIFLHGPPKIGKTTWASKADRPLFLATEAGLNFLDAFQVPVTSWEVFRRAVKELQDNPTQFGTVVVDTVDNAYTMCADYVCKKLGIEHPSDLGFGKGFGAVLKEFMGMLTLLSQLPSGLYLIGHTREKEIKAANGKVSTRACPNLSDSVSEKVKAMADFILYFDHDVTTDPPSRIVRTQSGPDFDAGNRAGVNIPATLPIDYAAFKAAFERK